MKSRIFVNLFILTACLLSACGGSSSSESDATVIE